MNEWALEVEHLTCNYDNICALFDVSLQVPKGQLVGVIGPNGAGKSTFIKTILGLIPTISGQILIDGMPINKARAKVAWVPQKGEVDWNFPTTVLDVVVMGRYKKLGLFKNPQRADFERADQCLDIVGLRELKNRQISELSEGQKQRVFIARALIQDSDILLMDEPFSGVDQKTENILIEILRKLKDQNKTIFIVHHDLNTIKDYFDWLIILNMRLIENGPCHEVFTQEVLEKAYGTSKALFVEATKKQQEKLVGKI